MIEIEQYTHDKEQEWDDFCNNAKNSLFMFNRRYMEYHSDRFHDHSLMFRNDGELIALLPMNDVGEELFSHGGLTYGGFITGSKMKQHLMDDCFDALINYCKDKCYKKLLYKPIPHVYHTQAAEEDKYSLYINGAKLLSIEASTVINLSEPLKMPKGRKAQISRARREGVIIEELCEDKDFEAFIELENRILMEKHGFNAVHTGKELALLHGYFPENIHLVGATLEGELIGGTVIFEYGTVVHTQYMATNEKAREIGALDLAVSSVINKYKGNKLWLDFGISTEDGGRYLNEGLISQKEGFGGRTNVYEKWELNF